MKDLSMNFHSFEFEYLGENLVIFLSSRNIVIVEDY